jgi:hypothetical protein
MADLTSQVAVKRALGIPSAVTQHDAYIDTLIEVVDKQVLAYTGQAALTLTTLTDEAYDVTNTNTNEFTLRNFPVNSIAAITAGGQTMSSDSYYLEPRSGTVRLTNGSQYFTEGRQQVKVTYSIGFSSVPADISYAATLCAVAHFNRGRHAGMTSEGMGSYRYSLDNRAMPSSAAALLAAYRRIFPKESQPT